MKSFFIFNFTKKEGEHMAKKNKQQQQDGPSKPSKVNSEQMQWHAVSSDDEEAYANEMEQLTKD